MKYCFIINPVSGKSATKEGLDERIKSACEAAGVEYDILVTRSQGDATRFVGEYCAKNSADGICFYACGGDGTLCEVVSGVMALEDRERVSVGVVPVGTGNDFVKNFAPTELFLDFDAQIKATPLKIDLIKCNDIYAINMINIGFDSEVVVKTGQFKTKKFIPSKLAYICGLAATLIKKPGVEMDISIDGGEPVHKDLLLTTFANGSFCGGGFHSNPLAELSDGNIDTLFIKDMTRIQFVSLVGDYKKGTHLVPKYSHIMHNIKAKEYDIEFSRPTNVSVDGEIILMDKLHLSVEREALGVLVPFGVMAKAKEAEKEMATV